MRRFPAPFSDAFPLATLVALVAAFFCSRTAQAQVTSPVANEPAAVANAPAAAGPETGTPAPKAEAMEAVVVSADRVPPEAPPAPQPRTAPALSAAPVSFQVNWNLPDPMGAVVVTATRTPRPPEHVAATITVLQEPARTTPALALDGALRSVPGFSLFRRSDSLTANPTAQGVSLRGLGPSGASRSLVLLDGVPLNDPFGGWVTWSKVPREGLARAEIVPGGGSAAWGNAALGGVVQLFVFPARTEMTLVNEPPSPRQVVWRGRTGLSATLGDFGTRSAELILTHEMGRGVVQAFARDFSTDGYALVAPERRGPIDVPAWSRHRWLMLRLRHPVAENMELTATVRGFEEKRGNGTPYQQNQSREKFVSLALAGQPKRTPDFAWSAVAYGQDQSFASTFSAVNATRTVETPASDQFSVPSTAFGAAWTGTLRHSTIARTTFGADGRFVRGETREHFTFVSGAFTRLRVAGGEQGVGGVFGLHEWLIAPGLRGTLGGRIDRWNEADGHRRESDRVAGTVLRDDRYADRDGTAFSPNAGLVWHPHSALRLRANLQQAFRRPTLNELYRPFRQGANVTEANPALATEEVTSGEAGVELSFRPREAAQPKGAIALGRPDPAPFLVLGATAFWNDLRDAVGNVTIARGPGTFPIVGFLAAGGLGRQRLNLDRVRVQGLELSARWRATDTLSWRGDYLYNDASVTRALVAPALVGKRVAQVPRQSASLSATWRAPGGVVLAPRIRWIGRQFEDDENQLVLGEVVVADLGLSRALGKNAELFINIENLGDARIETGRSADGVVNTGTPRLAFGGLRFTW